MHFNLPLFPEQASTIAGQVDAFYLFLVLVTTFFSLLIALLILFFIIRYRRRPDHEAEQIHGSTLLEIVWTVLRVAGGATALFGLVWIGLALRRDRRQQATR